MHRSRRIGIPLLLVGPALALGAGWPRAAEPSRFARPVIVEPDTRDKLEEALEIYHRTKGERLFFATDRLERAETLIGPRFLQRLAASGRYEELFMLGDESFEAERDRELGLGRGPYDAVPTLDPSRPIPAPGRRLQLRDLGGLDSGSCRSCHFTGGPDGAGAYSQVALLRSDGRRLETAIVRDPPHVMGVGYIEIVARRFERRLREQAEGAVRTAEGRGEPFELALVVDGIDFGTVTGRPDGTLDTRTLVHAASDLVIRPFGRKGRSRSLVAFADEALQAHHGMQTDSRRDAYADRPGRFLGGGRVHDPDDDGVEPEGSAAQAVLLASYLSMLPIPVIRPPQDPELLFAWSRGRVAFDEIGCAGCHVPELRFDSHTLEHRAIGTSDLVATLDLAEVGQEPVPRRLDFGPDEEGFIESGVAIHPFTDLRLHDLGAELADAVPETLSDGRTVVPANLWLTRSLWGLADTAPYLHDGRAPTVHDAILQHGGDAAGVTAAYAALRDEDRRALLVFLLSLTREGTLLVE